MAFLDETGLSRVWSKIKQELNLRVKTVNNVAPDANGNVNVSGGSDILTSPNGSQYKLSVTNDGRLVTTLVYAPVTIGRFDETTFDTAQFN